MIGIALSLATVCTAWLVYRHNPAHRPVVVGLACQAAVAALCLAPVPPRVAMAVCACLPLVSAAVYLRAFRVPGVDGSSCGCAALLVVGWTLGAPLARLWWPALLPALYVAPVGLGALAWRSYARSRRAMGITQRTAAVLIVGDALMLATVFARELAPAQACLVAGALLWLHARWLEADARLRGARGLRSLLSLILIQRTSP
jgi:hypothetical protein